jgi:UDP-2,3-diacylglucosamine pyrophosphatase LpxH
MSKRYSLLVSIILLFNIAAISSAADNTWNNNASDGNWNTGSNWSTGNIPNTTSDYARIKMASGPIFTGQTATAYRVYLEGSNGTLTMNGGSLSTNSHIYAAAILTDTATINMSSGAINIAATFYIARDSGSVANVNLSGGTITCNTLSIALNGGNGGLINITSAGKLIINGDATSTIATYVTNGWIKAYNGTGTVMKDYNISTSGKTTVWAAPPSTTTATNPNPANGAINIPTTGTTLSWTAGVSATSHNVYFGTANPPAYIGNQTAATYNPGTLALNTTYYWRVDEVQDANHIYTGTVWSFTTQGSFKKGPYLIYPGNNAQMTVLWQMSNTIGCTLAWGLDPNCTTGSTATTEYGTDHQHKYTITGLTPGTKYYYKITAGSATGTGSFKTAPAANATKVKFFAYGDTRTYPADHSTVCAGMNSAIAADPAFQTMVLQTGDWSEFDTEASWTNEFFNRSYPPILQMQSTLPIQGTIGNHESSASCFTKYWPYTYVAGKYWSFDYGPAHIAVIDQYSSDYTTPGSPQLTWLANDLHTSTKKWKFIVLHQPGWSDSLNGVGGGHDNDAAVQANIQPLCVQYGVQIVFCGHNHYYARADVNGVHHITSGGGGAPLYTLGSGPNIVVAVKSFDFCKITIDGNSLTYQAVEPNGTVLDTFYIDQQPPEFTFAQVTDVQLGMEASQSCPGQSARWQEAVNMINKIIKPAFVIDTGDHVQNWSDTSSLTTYLNIEESLKPNIPIYHIPGNHDIGDTPASARYAGFLSVFPNPFPASSNSSVPWYSFPYGDTLFICLDSMVLKDPSQFVGEDTAEINWLTNVLQNSSQYAHKIVFMHIAPCLVSTTEPDQTFNMPSVPGNSRAYSNIRATLLNLFHQYGVNVVLDGHYHVPAYVNDSGLEIITTESTTCPLGGLDVSTCGMQQVDIYSDHIVHTYKPLTQTGPVLPGDFNGDGIVDFKDLGIFTGHWLDTGIWP